MRRGMQGQAGVARRAQEPEFSRPFALDRLGLQPGHAEIEAKPAERAALADRFDLDRLEVLRAELQLQQAGSGLVRVEGRLWAKGAQVCVVSLEPVPFDLELTVSLSFAPAGQLQEGGEVLVEAEGEDPPEPIEQGAIDLGEAVAQTLAVALDPFPRAADAVLAEREFGPGTAGEEAGGEVLQERSSPFAVLQQLRSRRGEEN